MFDYAISEFAWGSMKNLKTIGTWLGFRPGSPDMLQLCWHSWWACTKSDIFAKSMPFFKYEFQVKHVHTVCEW